MIHNETRFNTLIQEALDQEFSGWNFSFLYGRQHQNPTPWDYIAIVRQHLQGVVSLLDMGTGGGEILASLMPLPKDTHATESWALNIPIAKKRLEPLGVTVHGIEDRRSMPFEDHQFDLVINRHDGYFPAEVYRILKPGGMFITQQVGGQNEIRLNELLAAPSPIYVDWTFDGARNDMAAVGFEIIREEEAFPHKEYFDIGAVVFYLKVINWQIPDFSVEKYRSQLGEIHNTIESEGKVDVNQHSFLLIAKKPSE